MDGDRDDEEYRQLSKLLSPKARDILNRIYPYAGVMVEALVTVSEENKPFLKRLFGRKLGEGAKTC